MIFQRNKLTKEILKDAIKSWPLKHVIKSLKVFIKSCCENL